MVSENQAKWTAFSRKVSEEGIILLKNENKILPLGNEKVAIFGQAQIGKIRSDIRKKSDLLDALRDSGINYDKPLADFYENWRDKITYSSIYDWRLYLASYPELFLSDSDVAEVRARGAEKAIYVIGRFSGENMDMSVEKGDYLLSDTEIDLLEKISANFEHIIVVLNIGCSMDLEFLKKYNVEGVIYTGLFGDDGGYALTDILEGKVNPSGKLTSTLAEHYDDYSSSEYFGQHNGGLTQDYVEDIFVGYRWFDTFGLNNKVVFPFGYGLSYTKFSVENKGVKKQDGKIEVTLRVRNIGSMAGKEVLQCYYSAPSYDQGAKLGKPLKELCAFKKTKLLNPDEAEILTLSFDVKDMASYDDTGVTGNKSCWVLEKGIYVIHISTNGIDYIEVTKHFQDETEVLEKCHPITTTLPKRLLADGSFEDLPIGSFGNEKLYSVSSMEKSNIEIDESLKKCGNKVQYKILPGTGGGYEMNFEGISGNPLDFISVTINDTEIKNAKLLKDGMIEITLPVGKSTLILEAKADNDITAITFEKIDAKTIINSNGETIIGAHNFYEGSFYVDVGSCDDGSGKIINFVTNFILLGRNVVYKIEVQEAGRYDISFKYAHKGKKNNVNNVVTLAVSNIVQKLDGMIFENTYNEGENRVFKISNKGSIVLPKGVSYLKFVSTAIPFPDISEIILTRNENPEILVDDIENNHVSSDKKEQKWELDYEDAEPVGIQFKEVCDDWSKLKPFLEQLSNRELASVVSGTPLNATPYGDVGCNVPNFARGIPPAQTADGPGGLRQRGHLPTAYPACIILASTFNTELYKEYGAIMGEECLFYGVDLWLAPAINIFRSPCGGRNSSYASEDPYLAGIFATYIIKGVQELGVAATLKHYCANNTEFERLKSNSRLSERALREIYIKAFEIAIKEANPWFIMSSYNNANDIKVCENYELITTIPRDEWNWDGTFVTDWWNDSDHVEELKAGHDLKMATGDIDAVTAALDSGELTREQVYTCAERILKSLSKLKTANTRIK